MSEENHCPQCGAALPAQSPQGLCPGCLLKWGLESQTGGKEGESQPGAADRPPPTPEEIAAYFPDLEILELVGRGGMGVVYKARQKRLDRLVALKILAPKIGQDPAFAERFAREARAMAMLGHPHIVAVHDFGQTPLAPSGRGAGGEGSLYYFLMEFVDGVNLRRLLDTGKLAPEEALAIVPQICEALQYAHDHGVVHRDIKPENLLLDKEGRVKIADFGIAKLVGKESVGCVKRTDENAPPADHGAFHVPYESLTAAGQIMGTPQYMAPEQIEHPLQVDHRADIYSLGVVFYQMLTGELPIGRFAPPSKKVQIDMRLDEVVLRALEKEPARRYQQASEIKTHMETIVATPSSGVTSGSPYVLVSKQNGERVINWRAVVSLGLIVAGFILVGEVVFSLLLSPEWSRERLPWFTLSAVTFALLFVFGGLYRAFQVPLERLTPLDGLTPHSEAIVKDDAIEQARRQVKGPAIGLFVTGMFNGLVVIPVVIWALIPMVADLTANNRPGVLLVFIPLSLMAFSSLIIFAALKMKRLQAYGLAIAASILAIIVSPGNLIGLPIGIWALVVLSQRDVRAAFGRKRECATHGLTGRFVLKLLCLVIGVVLFAAIVVFGPSRYRAYRFRQSFVAEMMRLLPPTYHDEVQPRTGLLRNIEILDLVHSKYGEHGDRYVVQFKIVYEGLRTTSRCEMVGDRWGRYCGEWGGIGGYPRMQIFFGNWGADSLPSANGQSPGANAADSIGFGPVIERTLEYKDGPPAIDFATGKILQIRVRQRVTRAERYASFHDSMQNNGMDAVGQTDEPIRGLTGFGMIVVSGRNELWENPSVIRLQEELAGGTPATPAPMTVADVPPKTFGFATCAGTIGILQIVGFTDKPKGVNIRYRLVQGNATALRGGKIEKPTDVVGQKIDVEVVRVGEPAPKDDKPSGASASVEFRASAFCPVTWKEITTQDGDAQGLVFFDMETSKSLKPPFALKLTNRAPDIVELTSELKEWIKANDMDILFHFGGKTWEKMRLEMQEDFVGQSNQWETIKPETVLDHFAKKDADGFIRDYLPGTSSGMDYHGDWSSCQAFRTRSNTMGVLQDEGFENTSVRGVRLRYKLVQSDSAGAAEDILLILPRTRVRQDFLAFVVPPLGGKD